MQLIDLVGKSLKMDPGRTYTPLPGRITTCLLCSKPFLLRPYTGAVDQVCVECANTYRDCGRVICSKCSVTVCRVTPKVLTNGYYIKPRMVLHIDFCNVCKPGLTVSTIIEIAEYERMIRPKKIIIAKSYR